MLRTQQKRLPKNANATRKRTAHDKTIHRVTKLHEAVYLPALRRKPDSLADIVFGWQLDIPTRARFRNPAGRCCVCAFMAGDE